MFEKILQRRGIPMIFRATTTLVFAIFLIVLYLGSLKIFGFNLTDDLVMTLIWGVWWPLLAVTLFFAARLWCGFLCPLGLITECGDKIHKGKPINVLKWVVVSYFIMMLFGWGHEAFGIVNSTILTFYLFIALFLFAFIVGLWLPRRSFCRLFCPIGDILGVFNRLSILSLRTKKEICASSHPKYCLIGTQKAEPCPMFINVPNIQSNRHCIWDLNCLKNCPYESVHFQIGKPGKEVEKGIEFQFSEAFFIVAFLGLLATLYLVSEMAIAPLFAQILGIYSWWLLLSIIFLGVLFATFIIYFLISFISAKLSGIDFKKGVLHFAYIYLPITYFALLSELVITYLLRGTPIIRYLSEPSLALINTTLISIGGLWSIYLAFKIPALLQAEKRKMILSAVPHIVFIFAVSYFWITFF